MWEVTLVGDEVDYLHFSILCDTLKTTLADRVVTAISGGEKLLCSIALLDNKNIGFAKTVILETIIKICKQEYFKTNLKILGNDEELNEFILISLTIIDLSDEVNFARVKAKISKITYIRPLVYFKLNKLVKVWERFVEYFNNSMKNVVQDEIYLEFLKFLACNTNSKTDIMYLEESSNEICIYDKNKRLLTSNSKSDEIGIVVNLIIYAPKKLIVNCFDSLSGKVTGLIRYIFEDRVCVLL